MASPTTAVQKTEAEKKDIKWTDARIRWPEDGDPSNDDDEEEENANPFDPFADPDPHQIFSFRFVKQKMASAAADNTAEETESSIDATSDDDESIRLDIHGYKTESDEVWESTGLTLWKASTYLCDYMVKHADAFKGQRVLELGAGLGLNGVLAHHLAAESVVITDGDSDALVELRKNIVVNRSTRSDECNGEDVPETPAAHEALSAAQLIWGLESSRAFLESIHGASSSSSPPPPPSLSRFSMIIASDVIYAAIVIDPLWETVRTLLRYPAGEFWMAFAVRKVPVTIEFVLQKAQEYGFRYELVDKQSEGGGDDDDVEGNPETGPVFIYVFRWYTEKQTEAIQK